MQVAQIFHMRFGYVDHATILVRQMLTLFFFPKSCAPQGLHLCVCVLLAGGVKRLNISVRLARVLGRIYIACYWHSKTVVVNQTWSLDARRHSMTGERRIWWRERRRAYVGIERGGSIVTLFFSFFSLQSVLIQSLLCRERERERESVRFLFRDREVVLATLNQSMSLPLLSTIVSSSPLSSPKSF